MNLQNIDLIWFTKWVSSFLIIAGMALTASQIYPLNMCMQLAGVTGWLLVGLARHDRSLITLNAVAAFIFANGIIFSLL